MSTTKPINHPDPDSEGGTCDVQTMRRAIDFIPPHIKILAERAADAEAVQPKRTMPQMKHDVLWNATRYFQDFSEKIHYLRNQLEAQGLHSVLPSVYEAQEAVFAASLLCSSLACAYWPARSGGRTQ